MDRVTTLFLLHLTGTAVIWDVRCRKIPNALAITGLLCGLSYQIACFRWSGLRTFFSGVLLTLCVTGWMYIFRMMGAGDIKLLAVIGGFLGPRDGFRLLVFTFLVGGVYSAALLIKRRNLYSRFFYLKTYITRYYRTKQWEPYRGDGCEDGYLYFSIPIFVGVICYVGGIY